MLVKKYKLNERYWFQKSLTYFEDTQLRRLVKDAECEWPANEDDFPALVDKLYTQKPEVFCRMIGVILKPDNRTLWRKLWNKLQGEMKAEALTLLLTKGEIAVVLADFFTLRSQWMFDLLDSKAELGLQKKYQKEAEKMLRQLKPLTSLVNATTDKLKQS